MASQATQPEPVTKATRPAVRLVVCGLPGSGKTSLLGALTLAAHKQTALFHGKFHNFPDDLKQLANRVYKDVGKPRKETLPDEVLAYPLTFQPTDADTVSPAIISDCSGTAAQELVHGKFGLEGKSRKGSLAGALRAADGLILLIDASLPPDKREQQFTVFGDFLRKLEEARGKRTEVSGLPVFLVLTKCDLLADPNDSMMDWMEEIEKRKNEVGAAFRDFLAREGAGTDKVPFGRIELIVNAVAIKWPNLTKAPPRALEPYLVAELFRQSLEKADNYRARRDKAGRRLFWTASTAAGLVLLMGSLTAGLAVYNQEKPRSELQARLDNFLSAENPSSAERLAVGDRYLRDRLAELQAMLKDPGFPTLPAPQQELIQDRIKEIQDYLAYSDRIMETPIPANLLSASRLRTERQKLETDLKPPEEYTETSAGFLYRSLLAEYNCLTSAVDELCKWFRDNGRKAQALWTFEAEDLRGVAWNNRARALLEQTSKLPLVDQETLPGCPTLKPGIALGFDQVKRDRDYFERMRQHLVQLRELLAALGMLGPITEPPPLLAIQEPFSLSAAGDLLRRVRQAYPDFEKEFVLNLVPDRLRAEVIQNARSYYEILLVPARQLVAKKQQEGGWDGVIAWLKNPTELAEWRILARVLNRLREPAEGIEPLDPVADLLKFLQTPEFTIYPSALILVVPDDMEGKIAENAKLTITHTPAGGEARTLVYALENRTGRSEGDSKLFTYVRSDGSELVYRRGDELQASLRLLGGGVLRWASKASAPYQFGRLQLPPRLELNGDSNIEQRFKLRKAPRVPDLLPLSAYE